MNNVSVTKSPAPPAIQPRGFPFRALLTISGARSLLPGLTEDNIEPLVERGAIQVAFDISFGSSSRRRELRLLPAAVDAFKEGKTASFDWDRVRVELLCGYGLNWISGVDMRLLLNCSSTHAVGIISVGRLALAPGSKCRPGPLGSPRVMLDSFLRWLKRRRIT